MTRQSRLEVDLAAIAHNATVLAGLAGRAGLCAVVKANGYGHGAVPVARAAVAGGAVMLGVATVEEGIELRTAGISAPILVLGPQPADSIRDAVAYRLELMVTSPSEMEAVAAAHCGAASATRVHLMVDTGMRRVGVEPEDLVDLHARALTLDGVDPVAVATHFACADAPDDPTTDRQLVRFRAALAALDAVSAGPHLIHAANSAGAITRPDARFDLVRCGISLYGLEPSPQLEHHDAVRRLRPALRMVSAVSFVKRVPADQGVNYGHRFVTGRPSTLATVPVGYGDGVPRNLGLAGGEALVGGFRRPIVGVVTMDQLVLDCTDGPAVEVGDEVVFLGSQPRRGEVGRAESHDGDAAVGPGEWARILDTINYEIVTRLGARLPRHHLGTFEDAALA